MRSLSQGFAAKLALGVTTLCKCWEFTRKDGVAVRFSEHDRELVIDNQIYSPIGNISFGQIEVHSNLVPDSATASASFNIDAISAEDILLGRWDNALAALKIVDWQSPEYFVEIWSGRISGFLQNDFGFELELAGHEKALDVPIGRSFSRFCDANLGDGRCKIDLTQHGRTQNTQIVEIQSDRRLKLSHNFTRQAHEFIDGKIIFKSGAFKDIAFQIVNCESQGDYFEIETNSPTLIAPLIGDNVEIIIGCDKSFETCKTKFANVDNFRGCPHMPSETDAFKAAI